MTSVSVRRSGDSQLYIRLRDVYYILIKIVQVHSLVIVIGIDLNNSFGGYVDTLIQHLNMKIMQLCWINTIMAVGKPAQLIT